MVYPTTTHSFEITQGEADLSDEDYFAAPGLSDSGMRDMLVSPFRYWYLHLSPNKPTIKPTPAMRVGSALHCAVLEGDEEFERRYYRELNPADHPSALDTVKQIKEWCRDKGSPTTKTLKDECIAHALTIDPNVPVLQLIEQRHFAQNQGKDVLTVDQWQNVTGATQSLKSEPKVCDLLSRGKAEVPYFYTDPKTGMVLKAKMDWIAPSLTVDIKTFTQQRGKSIDKSVADAIFYEQYYRKAFFYTMLRSIVEGESSHHAFILVFVESDPPHEVRIKRLRPKVGESFNLFWERGRLEVMGCIERYQEYMGEFGTEKPWRYAQEITMLADEELPAGINY